MLHKQSTDTQLCPHRHQGWAVTQFPSKPQDSPCTVRRNIGTHWWNCCLPLTPLALHLFPDETALSYCKIANSYTLELNL